MKKIRSKLFLIFLFFIASSVAIGMVLNVLFLERYYIYQNKTILDEVRKEVETAYRSQPNVIAITLRTIESENGVNISILNRQTGTEINAVSNRTNNRNNRLPKEVEKLNPKEGITSVFVIAENKNDQTPRLMQISLLDTGELIVLRKPMKGIRDSVGITNQFYLIAGFLITMIGGSVVYGFAKRLTRPIIEMSEVAGEIAELKFDRKIEIQSNDEIGKLGESINRTSEKLAESIEALQADLDRRKQLVRDLSHELKTPIGVIKGYVEGLRFGVADDPVKANQYYQVIVDECDRMNRMVREMLHLSLMESPNYQLERISFDAVPIIVAVMERFAEMAREREIVFELKHPVDSDVIADKELFERCVNNFVSNAIHHATAEKKVVIEFINTDIESILHVMNSGLPIDEIEQEKIWDIYYKVDQARTRKYGGHGLGLSIVKKIMNLHDGAAEVSNVDGGVLFTCRFPKQRTQLFTTTSQ